MTEAQPYRRLLSGAGLVTLGNATAAGLGLVLLLILARTLPPGELAIVIGVVAIIDGGQMLLDGTINTGMVNVASRDGQAGRPSPAILKAALLAKGVLGVVFAIVIGLLARPMSNALLGDGSMTLLVIFAGIAAAIAGLHSFVIGVLQAHEAFGRIAFMSVWKNFFRILAVSPWLLAGSPDAWGASLAICGATALTFLISLSMISWGFLKDASPLRDALRRLGHVNSWMALAAISMFGGRLDVWLVGILSTAADAGRYAVAAQLCVGVGVVTQALVTTFLPTISRFREGAEIRQFLRRWLRTLPFALLIPLLVWPFSEPVIRLVFGANYAASAATFNVLFLASIMTLAGAPLMLVLLSLGEARILGLGSLGQMMLRIGMAIPIVPRFGAVGLAVADVMSRFIAMALIGLIIWRAINRAVGPDGGASAEAPLPVGANEGPFVAGNAPIYRVTVAQNRDEAAIFEQEWQGLAEQTGQRNVFFEHWAFLPALDAFGTNRATRLLFVFTDATEGTALVAVMPFELRRSLRGLPLRHLVAWQHSQLFLATPLVAAGHETAAWAAVFEWARRENIAFLQVQDAPLQMAAPGVADGALRSAGGLPVELDRYARAVMTKSSVSASDYIALSGSAKARKTWRRQRRRLSETGSLVTRTLSPDEPLDPWIDEFLALEAGGWKGREGTALGASDAETVYFRAVCRAAADRGALHMMGLFVDDRPVAMQCNLFSGGCGFAFKVAYDENRAEYSPGVLLELDAIKAFYADDSVEWVDSCTGRDHPLMMRLWHERRVITLSMIAPGGLKTRMIVRALTLARRLRSRAGKIRGAARGGLSPARSP